MVFPVLVDKLVIDQIGNTPQLRLNGLNGSNSAIYAKLEWRNPFGSVKDRAALYMIRSAEKAGLLKADMVIIEPTSGNTGIALAAISNALGYKIQIVIPEGVSSETKDILKSLGAQTLETEDDLCPRVGTGTDQSIALAEAIVRGNPKKYFMPNQYENEANYLAHFEGTGPEIWRDTDGQITDFVAGIGTGGTLTGAGAFLKQKNSRIRIHGVEPQKGHHIQGLRNLQESSMPAILKRRFELIDTWDRVSDAEAFDAVRELAAGERLLVGPSSGAVHSVAKRVAAENPGAKVVAIFGDDGRKFGSVYRAHGIFSDSQFSELSSRARF